MKDEAPNLYNRASLLVIHQALCQGHCRDNKSTSFTTVVFLLSMHALVGKSQEYYLLWLTAFIFRKRKRHCTARCFSIDHFFLPPLAWGSSWVCSPPAQVSLWTSVLDGQSKKGGQCDTVCRSKQKQGTWSTCQWGWEIILKTFFFASQHQILSKIYWNHLFPLWTL